jgi:hypothetical protein
MHNSGKTFPDYFNPISFVVLAGSIPMAVFVGSFFVKQTSLVMRGLTTKQYDSIKKKKIYIDNQRDANDNVDVERAQVNPQTTAFMQKISLSQKFQNVYVFLKKRRPESLVTDSYLK